MTPAELIQQIDAHCFENISVLPSDTLSVPETEMDLFSHEILRILQDPAFDIAGFFSMLQQYCASIPFSHGQLMGLTYL